MVFYFAQMLLNPASMLLQQLQACGDGVLALAAEFGIASDIANRHPCCSQALEEPNPDHILLGIRAIAMSIIAPNGLCHQTSAFIIAQCMSTETGNSRHLLYRQHLISHL